MFIAIFIIFSLSYIDYEITDCQTTITYFGYGTITKNDGQYAKGKKKIIICEGITEISSYSFSQTTYQTSALNSFLYEEIELPRSLEIIGSYAFQNYYSHLKKIHFVDYPYGISSSSTFENELESFYSLRYIGSYAFNQNNGIVCHNIPPTFTTLEPNTFSSCSIKHIKLNSKLTTIGSYSFEYCTLLKSIVIPCYVKKIEAGAFYNCIELCQIKFERILELIIEDHVFYNCSSLQQVIFPPNVIFEESENIFSYCISLESVQMPTLMRGTDPRLPDYMFQNCINLKFCTIPENLEIIPFYMFYNTSIEHIYLPETVYSINGYAFANCFQLKYIEMKPNSDININSYAFENSPNIQITVFRGNSKYRFNDYSLYSRTICILDPFPTSFNNIFCPRANEIYSTEENKYYYSCFSGFKVVSNGECNLPSFTIQALPDDPYDSYPWTSDCSGYSNIPPCSCNDCGNGCPDVDIPTKSRSKSSIRIPTNDYRTHTISYSPSKNNGNNNGNNQGTTNKDGGNSGGGLSGGAIAGITVGSIAVVVIVCIFCCVYVQKTKLRVGNSAD